VNGVAPRSGAVPGPVTRQLTDAYRRFVDYDFVAQYLKHLDR
jgi:branched-chain amino acid aminotransferase